MILSRYLEGLDDVPSNPVDDFCTQEIERVVSLAEFAHIRMSVHHSWATPRMVGQKCAHMQTAGHVAGVAEYEKNSYWSIHPVYGTWFVYRAVVVLDIDHPTLSPPSVVSGLLSEEGNYLDLSVARVTEL